MLRDPMAAISSMDMKATVRSALGIAMRGSVGIWHVAAMLSD
jgi:hypothetical protein